MAGLSILRLSISWLDHSLIISVPCHHDAPKTLDTVFKRRGYKAEATACAYQSHNMRLSDTVSLTAGSVLRSPQDTSLTYFLGDNIDMPSRD